MKTTKAISKKVFDKFNKDVETLLLNSNATIVVKNDYRIEFSLPTYYGFASFHLHIANESIINIFSIFGNTNHTDSNLLGLFDISANTKTNIHTYDATSALTQLSDTIKKLQTIPVL